MKKLMAALLAVAMVCAMAIPAWAAGGAGATTGEGKITIDNAVIGHTYKIYRILNLQYNDTAKSFRYEKNDKWGAFVEGQTTYLSVDSKTGVVTWANSDNADNGTAIKALAIAAGQYVKDQGTAFAADDSKVAASSTVIFDNLPLGWYLVVSDLTNDAICSIDTTAKQVTIKEKNGVPTVTKEVEYASGSWGQGNDGNVGDTVNFQTTINVTDGDPTNYVLHDQMSKGLTFKENSIAVKVNDTLITNYTVEYTNTDKCTFEISFPNGTLHTNDTVVVTYSATINNDAVVGTAGNENETWLKYGNNGETTHGHTKTYTWKFNILKYFTDSNDDKKYLANVEFVLYRKNADDKAEYAKFDPNNKLTGWTENESEAGKLTTNATSNVTVKGLDKGTYFLKETATPVGFNGLTSDVEVQIDSSCNTLSGATYTVKYKMANANDEDFTDTDVEKVVPIENNRGTTLPGTGGIGTTIFYVVGGGLMVAAAILLITKKRMENR